MNDNMLSGIKCPADIKQLDDLQLKILAEEIRQFLIENISRTGGHLASNLGVVELTLALHKVFDSPCDKFIFDVGHQAYVHKILTGRCERFPSLRTRNGISGFPKRSESEHDILNTGHSSTSISAALGICRARDLKNEDYEVIAIIGDGSLTNGMAFEALNDAAASGSNITVLLNDNGMAISRSVGALSKHLTKLRTRKTYKVAKKEYEKVFSRIPLIGKLIITITEKIKSIIKFIFLDDVFFEQMGFVYMGIVDGHNISELTDVLRNSRDIKKPKLIHVSTQKGKGYSFAESNPDIYHGVSPFTVSTGLSEKKDGETYTDITARTLEELMTADNSIVVITAAMTEGLKFDRLRTGFGKRYFDVGIAEEHAVTMSAGMAISGIKPVVAIYSTFLQRAYDQMLHDVVLNSLPVLFLIDRAGLVGEDGETHHGIYDLAYLLPMPGMLIMAPSNDYELVEMLRIAIRTSIPAAIRYPRDKADISLINKNVEVGKADVVRDGTDCAIFVCGPFTDISVEAAKLLNSENISAAVINARFIKPLDTDTFIKYARITGRVLTIEDGVVEGGFGSLINSVLINQGVKTFNIGINNNKIPSHATRKQLLEENGFTIQNIVNNVKILFNSK